MCKDYDPPTVYQNAFRMEEEGHSLCTLKKNLKWVRTRGEPMGILGHKLSTNAPTANPIEI